MFVGWLFQQNSISATELTTGVVGDLLLRLCRSEFGIPHRERDLPDGDPRDGDSVLLRDRNRRWRDHQPALYGHNIATGNRTTVFLGYLLGAGLMIVAGLIEVWLGVDAEQRQLEDVATPLTAKQ